jgi:hypothetical protein
MNNEFIALLANEELIAATRDPPRRSCAAMGACRKGVNTMLSLLMLLMAAPAAESAPACGPELEGFDYAWERRAT